MKNNLDLKDIVVLIVIDNCNSEEIMTISVHKNDRDKACEIIKNAESDWYDNQPDSHYDENGLEIENDAELMKIRLTKAGIEFGDMSQYLEI